MNVGKSFKTIVLLIFVFASLPFTPIVDASVGGITSKLSGAAKGVLGNHLMLFIQNEASDGSALVSGILKIFANPMGVSMSKILSITKETLALVEEVDEEVDALTVRVEELFLAIEKGFAEGTYDATAKDLDSVYNRVNPLWNKYTAILTAVTPVEEGGGGKTLEEVKDDIDKLMVQIDLIYGKTGFLYDFMKVHDAMYKASGATTFTDAQVALSRLNYPFEHQVLDEATVAFNYGASIQAMLMQLYREYAEYVDDPTTTINNDQAVNDFANIGNMVIDNINLQAETSVLNNLARPENIDQQVKLDDGSMLDVYKVVNNADEKTYLIGKKTVKMSDTVSTSYSPSTREDKYKPAMTGVMKTSDGRWYIPSTEAEFKTLFTPTISNPASYLADEGKLTLPQNDAFMMDSIQNKEETYYNSINKYTRVMFDQGILDSHYFTQDKDMITVNSYHDIYLDGTYKFVSRGEKIKYKNAELLLIYFDATNAAGGIPKDPDTGYYMAKDPTTYPDTLHLGDGQGVDFTYLNSTDFAGKTFVISGNVTLIGGGRTYKNLQLQLQEGAKLTLKDFKLNQTNMSKAAVDVYKPGCTIDVYGDCELKGGSGMWLDYDATVTVFGHNKEDGSKVKLLLSGTQGIASDYAWGTRPPYSVFEAQNIDLSLVGAKYGIKEVTYTKTRDCVVWVKGDEKDLFSGETWCDAYFERCKVTFEHNLTDGSVYSKDTEFPNGVSWNVDIYTADVYNAGTDDDVFISCSGSYLGAPRATDWVNIHGDYHNNKKIERDTKFWGRSVLAQMDKVDTLKIKKKGSNGWYPSKIVITDYCSNKRDKYSFPINYWIDEKDREFVITPPTYAQGKNPPYTQTFTERDGQTTETLSSVSSGANEEVRVVNRLISVIKQLENESTIIAPIPKEQSREVTMTGELLKTLQESPLAKRLAFNVYEEEIPIYGWVLDADKIREADMSVPLSIDVAPAKNTKHAILFPGKNAEILDFSHSGPMMGPVTVWVNAKYYGFDQDKALDLYHIENGRATRVASDLTIDDAQSVKFSLDHASVYALVPQIGDVSDSMPYCCAAAFACLVLGAAQFIARRKMRRSR